MTTFAKDRLKAFVERIERLEEEKKAIADDIRDIYAEAKSNGYDVKALREIVKLRKVDAGERREHEAILETYMHALGMLATTELGQAALARKQDELAKAGRKLADDMSGASDAVRRAAASPAVRKAVKSLGTPVELTDDEKAKGYTAAFMKGDTRMTIGLGGDVGKPKSRAAPAARPDDKVITPPIDESKSLLNQSPIPAQPGKPQVGHAGFRSALSEPERPDGAERPPIPNPDPMLFCPASDSSAPLSPRHDLGGADDLLDIPAFLRRTADNRVPA